MSLVRAENLQIPGRLALTSLTFEAGTLTCLLGPNGSGKTSLLHALAGIGSIAGQVTVGGQDIAAVQPAQRIRLLGFLPASRDLPWPISGRDLVALSGASDDEVDTAVARMEAEELAGRRADLLSTGERSRVLIARALAPRPLLLLLDEPTSNLDPLWQLKFMALLREEVRGRNCAVVVALHDVDAAARGADRLLLLKNGRIFADGGPELIESPAMTEIFGIERAANGWQPAKEVNPSADRRSSP